MDGRKNNTGKRKGDKVKIPITIYKPKDEVDKIGGVYFVRDYLSQKFDSIVSGQKN